MHVSYEPTVIQASQPKKVALEAVRTPLSVYSFHQTPLIHKVRLDRKCIKDFFLTLEFFVVTTKT